MLGSWNSILIRLWKAHEHAKNDRSPPQAGTSRDDSRPRKRRTVALAGSSRSAKDSPIDATGIDPVPSRRLCRRSWQVDPRTAAQHIFGTFGLRIRRRQSRRLGTDRSDGGAQQTRAPLQRRGRMQRRQWNLTISAKRIVTNSATARPRSRRDQLALEGTLSRGDAAEQN